MFLQYSALQGPTYTRVTVLHVLRPCRSSSCQLLKNLLQYESSQWIINHLGAQAACFWLESLSAKMTNHLGTERNWPHLPLVRVPCRSTLDVGALCFIVFVCSSGLCRPQGSTFVWVTLKFTRATCSAKWPGGVLLHLLVGETFRSTRVKIIINTL